MVNVERLAVGLAVGIPGLIVVSIVIAMWFRNQSKQRKEDEIENDIDIGLNDNKSFNEFQEELHKPLRRAKSESSTADAEKNEGGIQDNGTSSNDSNSTHFVGPGLDRTHHKTPSSYDFYESVIPIIPKQGTSASSHGLTDGSTFVPPPSHEANEGNLESASSTTSLNGTNRDHSLDNLAKQLTSPTFFEKLPSRAGTVSVKKTNSYLANNSSHDLVVNSPVNENAINENYIYESSPVKSASSTRDARNQRQTSQKSPLAPKVFGSGSNLHEQDEQNQTFSANSSVNSPFVDVPDIDENSNSSDNET